MASYAVIWTIQAIGDKPLPGRLEVGEQGVELHGGSRSTGRHIEIPNHEILSARRTRDSRGPRQAIELDTASAGTILIVPIADVGCRGEILEQLQRLAAAYPLV